MPSIKVTEEEMTVLFGLPHLSIVLYMLGLRPRMDFANGTVGVKPLISWQALREAIYVEPHPGIKHQDTSYDAIRRAAGWLEKAGLIRMRSRDRQLIFFLPMAHADFSVRNKAASSPPDQADRPIDSVLPMTGGRENKTSRQTKIQKAATHPVSGKPLLTPPPHDLVSTGAVDNSEGAGGLVFPQFVESDQKPAMAKQLTGLGVDMAQSVLDELAGCIQAGGVRNVPALYRKFIEQAKAGDFMPDKGRAIKKGRAQAVHMEVTRLDQERRSAEEARTFVKGAGRPANLRDLVKRRG
jgi:hypothetical protein